MMGRGDHWWVSQPNCAEKDFIQGNEKKKGDNTEKVKRDTRHILMEEVSTWEMRKSGADRRTGLGPVSRKKSQYKGLGTTEVPTQKVGTCREKKYHAEGGEP